MTFFIIILKKKFIFTLTVLPNTRVDINYREKEKDFCEYIVPLNYILSTCFTPFTALSFLTNWLRRAISSTWIVRLPEKRPS